MEGLAYATGVALRWWRDIYGSPEVTVAKAADVDPYDIICMEAAKSPAGSRGYIFFPFFSSQVTPYYHDNARGGSLGISLAHNRADMARGVLEGGGYELRMIVEAMERVLGKPFDVIRLSGGRIQISIMETNSCRYFWKTGTVSGNGRLWCTWSSNSWSEWSRYF